MAGVESRVGGVQRLRSPDLSAPQDPLSDSLGTGCHSWNRDQPITLSHKAAPCTPLASRATHASHCHQPPVCDSTFAGSLPLQHHPFSLAASVVPTPSRTSEPPIDAWPHPRLIYLILAGLLAPRWFWCTARAEDTELGEPEGHFCISLWCFSAHLCLGPHSALPPTTHVTLGKPVHLWRLKSLHLKMEIMILPTL